MNNIEYLKNVYELFRQLYKTDSSDKEISLMFQFQAATRIPYDKESPSMAVIFDLGSFYGIDTPFGRFQYKFAFPMKEEFNQSLKQMITTTFEGEKLDDLSDFFSLSCAEPVIYSIRKLPWSSKRLSKTSYDIKREGCLSKTEVEAVLDEWNKYIENYGKPETKRNIFDILFHKKTEKKKF